MADSKPSTPSQASPSVPETYTVDDVIYSVHPLASLFPLLKGVAYDEFLSDVVRRGIAKPVLRRGTEIIDGRNRLRAAADAGKKVPWAELPDFEHPAAAIMTANIHVRQITASQRAVFAKKLRDAAPEVFAPPAPPVSRAALDARAGTNGGSDGSPPSSGTAGSSPASAGKAAAASSGAPAEPDAPRGRRNDPTAQARKVAAEKIGVSDVYQRQAEHVEKDAPELFDAVGKGDLNVRDAYAVRGEAPQVREAALADVRAGREKTAVAAVESRTGRAPKAQPPSQRRKSSPAAVPAGDTALPPMPVVPGTSGAAPARPAAGAPSASGVNPDMLTPTLLLAGVRLVLGDIDLDPCSNADAQDRISAGDWYSEEQDGLKQTWKGTVWVFPSLEAAPAFAQKLASELRGGTVTRAGLLAPADLSQEWVAKLLELRSFSAVVVERERGVYDVAGAVDNARCPAPMAVYLFGLTVPPEKLVKAVGPWGRVLVNAPGQTA